MEYFHGYSEREFQRLIDQAIFLAPQVYPQLHLPESGDLLEIGCGVGAQTRILAEKYPELNITGVDVSAKEIESANSWLDAREDLKERIEFIASDFLEFESHKSFDAAFICWMLEHVPDPQSILDKSIGLLKPGGSIHITEVQNNTLYLFPKNTSFEKYWRAYCRHQQEVNGNPFIGAHLRKWLSDAGFSSVTIKPHHELFDQTDSGKLNEITNYWWDLLDSVGDVLQEKGYISADERKEVKDYLPVLSSQENALFFYAFIQAEGRK